MDQSTTSPPSRTANYEVRQWEQHQGRQWYVVNRETGHRVGDFHLTQGAAERWMVCCQEDYEAGRQIGERRQSDLLTTGEAADLLGIDRSRVLRLIESGRLVARKVGRDWVIEQGALEAVRHRRRGRPLKGSAGKEEV